MGELLVHAFAFCVIPSVITGPKENFEWFEYFISLILLPASVTYDTQNC